MENFRPIAERIGKLAKVCGVFYATPPTPDLGEFQKRELRDALDHIEEDLRKFELDAALDRMEIDGAELRSDYVAVVFTYEKLNTLLQAIVAQLGRRYYVAVPPDVADFYENPLAKFPRSIIQFPSIKNDVEEACRCYALERYTAAVFHGMGILQVGLHSLAAEVGVLFPFKIELADWENVIEGVESKITAMRGPKSDKKDADLKFYSNLAVQFRYFKNAWRNHVAHLRDEYDKDQAHSIVIHVRDFMEEASTRLKELLAP